MCGKRSSVSSWRWYVLVLALFWGIASVTAQEAPLVPTTLSLTLSSYSTSELSALFNATLDEQERKSQEDRTRFEAYIALSEKAAESAMLRELSLSRTVTRLENHLTAAMKAIEASGKSVESSSDAFKDMSAEAAKMLAARNAWRAGAYISGGLALLFGGALGLSIIF